MPGETPISPHLLQATLHAAPNAIREFMRRGVVIRTVINNMTFDGATKDPMQQAVRDSLIAFMAALSQAQAESLKESQRAGIEHAKAEPLKYLGRKPSFTSEQLASVGQMLMEEVGTSAIAARTGLSRQAVLRIKADPVAAESLVARWADAAGARRRRAG